MLDVYGSNLVELAGELCNDAIGAGKRKTARKLEGAISRLHDVIDAAEDALDELAK
jgi:hypothetical protein